MFLKSIDFPYCPHFTKVAIEIMFISFILPISSHKIVNNVMQNTTSARHSYRKQLASMGCVHGELNFNYQLTFNTESKQKYIQGDSYRKQFYSTEKLVNLSKQCMIGILVWNLPRYHALRIIN